MICLKTCLNRELLSHIQLSEISMAGIRFNLRQGRKLSEEQDKQLFELSAKMKQLNLFLLREFKDDEELLGQYEKVTKLLEQLKERV